MGNRFPLPPTPYPLPATRYLLTPISFFSSLLCAFASLRLCVFFFPAFFSSFAGTSGAEAGLGTFGVESERRRSA